MTGSLAYSLLLIVSLWKGFLTEPKYPNFKEINSSSLRKHCDYEVKLYHEYQCWNECRYYFKFYDILCYAFGFENNDNAWGAMCCCMEIKERSQNGSQWEDETDVFLNQNCGMYNGKCDYLMIKLQKINLCIE